MVALLALKRYELSTGNVFLSSVRPALGAWAHRALVWVEYSAPALARRALRAGFLAARVVIHSTLAWGVLAAERGLETALKSLRRTTAPPQKESATTSHFLREVAAYKQEILKRTRSETTEE